MFRRFGSAVRNAINRVRGWVNRNIRGQRGLPNYSRSSVREATG